MNTRIKEGGKVKFTGARPFFFTNIIENAKGLEVGAIYTVSNVKSLSSWTSIQLEEMPNLAFNSVWFEVVQ